MIIQYSIKRPNPLLSAILLLAALAICVMLLPLVIFIILLLFVLATGFGFYLRWKLKKMVRQSQEKTPHAAPEDTTIIENVSYQDVTDKEK